MRRLVFILIIAVVCATSFAQTKSELEQKKITAQRELEMARELLDKTKVQKENTLSRLALLNKGISSRDRLINTISSEITLLDNQIDQMEKEIDDLNKDIREGREEYAKIIYSVYINHTDEEKLMYLLASEDINQFYQRVKYLKYLKEYREKKIAELEGLISELELKTAQTLKIRNDKSQLLAEKERENQTLVRERSERNGMISRLSQDEKRIRKQISEQERIRTELEDKIRKMIEAEAKKSSSNTLFTSLTPEQKLVGNSFLQNKGRLPWPVERGVVTANFGLINHPVLSGVKISNNGIDFSSPSGTKARAVFDGEVSSVFAILGANYAVIIMHGEYLSVYQNLVDLKVKVGDKVRAKQELGTIHADQDIAVLQLQIWKSRQILDPALWISK